MNIKLSSSWTIFAFDNLPLLSVDNASSALLWTGLFRETQQPITNANCLKPKYFLSRLTKYHSKRTNLVVWQSLFSPSLQQNNEHATHDGCPLNYCSSATVEVIAMVSTVQLHSNDNMFTTCRYMSRHWMEATSHQGNKSHSAMRTDPPSIQFIRRRSGQRNSTCIRSFMNCHKTISYN